jgi:hypothetical protein
MCIWVIEIIPLDISAWFQQAGYVPDDWDRIAVLHEEDEEAEMDDVVFAY